MYSHTHHDHSLYVNANSLNVGRVHIFFCYFLLLLNKQKCKNGLESENLKIENSLFSELYLIWMKHIICSIVNDFKWKYS